MEDPVLYSNSSDLQRRDTEDFLLENYNLFKKVRSKSDVIDIGCGDGFVTANILRKYLPADVKTLTGVDKSINMINFARKHYGTSELIFKIMNFDNEAEKEMTQKFDIVTSFYCFHWLLDVKKTIENIHNLLDYGGMCLFLLPLQHATFEVYKTLMKQPKWSEIMGDVQKNKCVPTMGSIEDYQDEYYKNLKTIGFHDIKLKSETKHYIYHSLESFTNFFKSVNPFIKSIPEDNIQELWDEMMAGYSQSPFVDMIRDKNGNIKSVIVTYKVLTVSAFK